MLGEVQKVADHTAHPKPEDNGWKLDLLNLTNTSPIPYRAGFGVYNHNPAKSNPGLAINRPSEIDAMAGEDPEQRSFGFRIAVAFGV